VKPERSSPRATDDDEDEADAERSNANYSEEEDDEYVEERRKRRRRPVDDDSELEDEIEDEEDEVEDRIRPRRFKGKTRDWMQVRQGLALILAGAVTAVGALAVDMLVVQVSRAGDAQWGGGNVDGDRAGNLFVSCIVLLAALAAVVLDLIGSIMCLASPEFEYAKTLAKLSLIIKVAGVLFVVVAFILIFAGAGMLAASNPAGFICTSRAALALLGLGYLLLVIQFAVFLLCLRALAITMRRSGLALNTLWLVIVFVFSFLLLAGSVTVVIFGLEDGPAKTSRGPGSSTGPIEMTGIVGSCCGIIMVLSVVVWYVVTITQVRAAIMEYVSRR